METPGGTPPEYTPPEIILGCKYDGLLSDIWSCGIILYAMLCGCLPFEDNNVDKLYTKIIKGDFSYPDKINISEEAKVLINKILVVNPRLRSNIIDIVGDNWFMKDYSQNFGLYISIRDIPYDNKIIEDMEKKYKIKKNNIIKYIKNNKHNNITALYYILVNKYIKEGKDTISDLISNEFKEYLREQNLKNSLIKKGEKPISLKITKSNSKPIFDINNNINNKYEEKVDLEYLKNIFKEYNESNISNTKKENKNKNTNNINRINIRPLKNNNKKNNNNYFDNNNKNNIKTIDTIFNIKRKPKSQNNKKIIKKNVKVKERYHTTSLNKKKIVKKEINKIKEYSSSHKKQFKENSSLLNNKNKKVINNIKDIIKKKNKTTFYHDFKNSILSKNYHTHKYLNIISTPFTKLKKNSTIINNNIFTINNESKSKLEKKKEIKNKSLKSTKIKERSLNNKLVKKNIISSRNYFQTQLNDFNDGIKTTTNYKYTINSTSNSKSKSKKSISNYSYRKKEKILSNNNSNKITKKNYFNIKINVIKPSIENNNNNKLLKEKNKIKEIKSISTSKSKNNKKNIINNKNKNLVSNKLFKYTQSKPGNKSNTSINKSYNKKTKNISNINDKNNIIDIKNNSIKYKNHTKIFSNTLQHLIEKYLL